MCRAFLTHPYHDLRRTFAQPGGETDSPAHISALPEERSSGVLRLVVQDKGDGPGLLEEMPSRWAVAVIAARLREEHTLVVACGRCVWRRVARRGVGREDGRVVNGGMRRCREGDRRRVRS